MMTEQQEEAVVFHSMLTIFLMKKEIFQKSNGFIGYIFDPG